MIDQPYPLLFENGELQWKICGVGDFILKVQNSTERQNIGKCSKGKVHKK